MTRRLILLLSVACVGLLTTPAAAAELLAVLELSGALPADQRRALTDAVREEATKSVKSSGIKVMTQENMETLLTDMGLDASCISEGACEVDTLRNLQANYGVTGKVTDFGGTFLVTLQLYEMRGGTMMTAEKVKGSDALILVTESVPAATRTLMASLPGVSAPPVAVVTPPVAVVKPPVAVVKPPAAVPIGPPVAEVPPAAADAEDAALASRIEAAWAEGAEMAHATSGPPAAEVPPAATEAGAARMMAALPAPPADWQPPAMARVPAGTYEVGCTKGQSDCNPDEKPKRQVTLRRAYEVMVHEVTQGEYAGVMGSNPSKFSSCGDSCPVERVSWVDAVTYANAVSREAGLEECYTIPTEQELLLGDTVSWPKGLPCTGYRLPTEMEWEVAARGGADTLYSGGNSLDSVGWTSSNSGSRTQAVMQKSPNAYGLYDMTGNVWEWTWDWYGAETYKERRVTDPLGPASGSNRVYRGGGWENSPSSARVASRFKNPLNFRTNVDLGFRLARTAD